MPQQILSRQTAHGLAGKEFGWIKGVVDVDCLSDKEREYLDKITKHSPAQGQEEVDAEHRKLDCQIPARRDAVSGFYLIRGVPGTKLVLRTDTEARKILLGDFSFHSATCKSVNTRLEISPLTCANPHSEQLHILQSSKSTVSSDDVSPKTILREPPFIEVATEANRANSTDISPESPAFRPIRELLQDSVPDVVVPVFLSTFTEEPAEMHGPYYRSNIELVWNSQPETGYDHWDEIESPCSDINARSWIGTALAQEIGLSVNATSSSNDRTGSLMTTASFPVRAHQASLSSCGTIIPQYPDTMDTSYRPPHREIDASNNDLCCILPAPCDSLESPFCSLQEPLLVRRGQSTLRIRSPATRAAVSDTNLPATHALAPAGRQRVPAAILLVANDDEASNKTWDKSTFLLDSEDE